MCCPSHELKVTQNPEHIVCKIFKVEAIIFMDLFNPDVVDLIGTCKIEF